MITRRACLSGVAGAAALGSGYARGLVGRRPTLLRRTIPGTSESLPVIGLGSSGSFEVGPSASARAALAEVLAAFIDAGGTLIDTSPNYGSAEDVLGDLIAAGELRPRLFVATKLAAEGREAGAVQFRESQRRLRSPRLDLLQVHNLRDWRTQFDLARELKQEGHVRYVGLTHYLDHAHAELAAAMKVTRPDFVQINLSIVSRAAERVVLPLAQEMGIAVIINRAFEDGQLFARVRGRAVPEAVYAFGVTSWAQLFLKFVVAHPAVTCVIPATSKARNLRDNLGAGFGPLPDAATRESWARLLL